MAEIKFCVGEYIDGVWGSDPASRPTDLPPHRCKNDRRWDSAGWSYKNDKEAYRRVYEDFAVRLKREFQQLAGVGEDTLVIDTDPMHTYYEFGGVEEHPCLPEAIKRAGLPTRKDVEEASEWDLESEQ